MKPRLGAARYPLLQQFPFDFAIKPGPGMGVPRLKR